MVSLFAWLSLGLGRTLWGLLSALSGRGERSEPEPDRAESNGRESGAATLSTQVRLWFRDYYFAFFSHLSFLRRQEHEASTLAQRVLGGARELVQPSDGF